MCTKSQKRPIGLVLLLLSCLSAPLPAEPKVEKLKLDDSQWRQRLTTEQYRILRKAGTERPGSGAYLHEKQAGTYHCAGCDLALFQADHKFDSGCGWPSFYTVAAGDRVQLLPDHSHGMRRVEVRCSRCDGHLGHVFEDGPKPTGLRYCINSVALKFKPLHARK